MALLSLSRIAQLFGANMPVANVSGSVDGTSHVDLVAGEVVVLTDIPYGTTREGIAGNFICMEGPRVINGVTRQVQTVGWMTPLGRLLNLGSMYKRDELDAVNPSNVGLPTSTVNRAELLPLLFGGTITVGAKSDIMVKRFQPKPDETATVAGTRYAFTFVPKV